MKTIRFALALCALVIVALSTAACGKYESQSVRSYCDSEISYKIFESAETQPQKSYRLHLRLGETKALEPCSSLGRLDTRQVNLDREVTSIEEAEKLIEAAKQQYAASLVAARVAQVPKKK